MARAAAKYSGQQYSRSRQCFQYLFVLAVFLLLAQIGYVQYEYNDTDSSFKVEFLFGTGNSSVMTDDIEMLVLRKYNKTTNYDIKSKPEVSVFGWIFDMIVSFKKPVPLPPCPKGPYNGGEIF